MLTEGAKNFINMIRAQI